MQFIQLRYFERVAAYQSISKAAEELHMSQPALSNSIRRLETDLGYPLFNRVGRQIILNNNGMRFLEIAKNILSYLNQCTLAEPRSSYQPAGTIHIGLYANVNDIVMAANNYSRINHNAQFQFHTTREVPPPRKLHSSDISYPAAYHPQLPDKNSDFVVESLPDQKTLEKPHIFLGTSNLCAVVSRMHRLASANILQLSQLQNELFCFLLNKDGQPERAYYNCLKAGFVPNVRFLVDQHAAKHFVIARGNAVGFVYSSDLHFLNSDLVAIPLQDDFLQNLDQVIYWKKQDPNSPAASDFWNYLLDLYKQKPS